MLTIYDVVFILIFTLLFIFLMDKYYVNCGVEGFTNEQLNNINNLFRRGYIVQPGMILSYVGNINNIPDGYVLCDGKNNTPDLRNRFIIGSGDKYRVGNVGGINSITLNTNNMPAHNHTGSGTTNTIQVSRCGANWDHPGAVNPGLLDPNATCPNTNHSHSFNYTTSSTGSNVPIDITPNYYALAFIMKISN